MKELQLILQLLKYKTHFLEDVLEKQKQSRSKTLHIYFLLND
jgi:hypothetical protein